MYSIPYSLLIIKWVKLTGYSNNLVDKNTSIHNNDKNCNTNVARVKARLLAPSQIYKTIKHTFKLLTILQFCSLMSDKIADSKMHTVPLQIIFWQSCTICLGVCSGAHASSTVKLSEVRIWSVHKNSMCFLISGSVSKKKVQ